MKKLIKISLKKLIQSLKFDNLNDKIVILINYVKKNEKKKINFEKNYVKK